MAGRGATTAFGDHCEWTGASATDRETWLRARRQGIGGSDVAAVLGVSRWNSALSLYVEKTSADAPDEESSEIADWGRIFEPAILKRYAERSQRRVIRGGKLMRSKRTAHHLITLDGVQFNRAPSGAKGPGVAEVKTTGYGERFHEDLPVEVQIQIQWELFVTGAEWATCIWLPFPERRLQWVDVLPHPAFTEQLVEAVDNFWQRVQRHEPPDPDGSESSTHALYKLYPEQGDEVIRIINATTIADEYKLNQASIALLEERQRLIRNTLAATMRDARHGLLDDGRYWGAAYYAPREKHCPHCTGLLSKTEAYRTFTLRAPKKKPLLVTGETRELVVNLLDDGDGGALEKQLSESLVGAPAPSNDEEKETA
jgi:putative phage-type endonuclease